MMRMCIGGFPLSISSENYGTKAEIAAISSHELIRGYTMLIDLEQKDDRTTRMSAYSFNGPWSGKARTSLLWANGYQDATLH